MNHNSLRWGALEPYVLIHYGLFGTTFNKFMKKNVICSFEISGMGLLIDQGLVTVKVTTEFDQGLHWLMAVAFLHNLAFFSLTYGTMQDAEESFRSINT